MAAIRKKYTEQANIKQKLNYGADKIQYPVNHSYYK